MYFTRPGHLTVCGVRGSIQFWHPARAFWSVLDLMHAQLVTFAFTAPRPSTWGAICWLCHEAKERALGLGIVKATVSRLDWGSAWQEPYEGFRYWNSRGKTVKRENPIPKGHIAILVEGFAEKED